MRPPRRVDGTSTTKFKAPCTEIQQMVLVLLDAMETPTATDDAMMFQMPYAAGDMLCFAAFDLDKRVTAFKATL
jgi:hypothetical protein